MVNLADIHALSDFQRNTKAHIKRLKKTGMPEVLTVNGHAEIVVQDAAAYQKLLRAAEQIEFLETLRTSLRQADRGEGRPMREALIDIAARAGIDLLR